MRSELPAYAGLFRMRLARGLSYRAAAIAGSATQFFWGFMLISVLRAFARSGGSPLDDGQIASYIWLQQAFLVLGAIWFRDGELVRLICSGDAAYELCRPVDLYRLWFARLAGGRLAATALRSLPILAVAFFLPEPWGLRLPASPAVFACFVLAMALATVMVVAVSMFSYALTMVTLNAQAGFLFVAPVFELCAGLLVPLPLMPDGIRRVLELLPFRYAADLPFRVWMGSIGLAELPGLLAAELAWLAVIVAGGRLALRAALRRAEAVGG